ncbi:hypothetical protein CVIRNUC_005434 [Coccomyxa viridis]|uniref:F-box domain-containing protein n=1 Tax=Coccomyxa viridis TaxID=1274662 RepID=A0AAV1I617_9CHLO|nr:hypothetical protein CVIRNUC_005434 [Coccomyxa viridis]
MRLRLKGQTCTYGLSKHVVIQDNASWQQLNQAIVRLHPELASSSYTLSLNKKDALHASAADCVKSLGICSGDLLWIQVDSASQSDERSEAFAAAQQASPGQHHVPADCQQRAAPGQAETDVSHLHRPGQLQQQAELRQEAGSGVGQSAGLADAPGRLAAAVHQTLLDGSLHHVKGSVADDASQASSLLAHKQIYTLSAHLRSSSSSGSEAACRVRYIAMGSHVVVWATTPSMGVRSMTLAADTAGSLATQAGQQAALLSTAAARRVHDELLLPVIQGLCSDEGLSPPTSLRTLPLEIKLLVLRNLPAQGLAVIACTCKEFGHLASAEELWEDLFQREFPAQQDWPKQPRTRSWRSCFAAAWKDRIERHRHQRSFLRHPRRPLWPAGPFPSRPPILPGINGGDFDRLPQPFLRGSFGNVFGSRHFQGR